MVFWEILKWAVKNQNKSSSKEELSQEPGSTLSNYGILNYYISLAGLDEEQKKWVEENIFLESRNEYIAKLYDLALESAGYTASKLLELKDKDPNTFRIYKSLIDKIRAIEYRRYEPWFFFIGLRQALDQGIKEYDDICYVLLTSQLNIFVNSILYIAPKKPLIEAGSFHDYLNYSVELNPGYAINSLAKICDKTNSEASKFIKCLAEKLKNLQWIHKTEHLSILGAIKTWLYSIDECDPSLRFLKYLYTSRYSEISETQETKEKSSSKEMIHKRRKKK